jgi:hypothetical protein
MRESGGQLEVHQRIVSVGFDRATQQRDRLLVAADKELGTPQSATKNAPLYRED